MTNGGMVGFRAARLSPSSTATIATISSISESKDAKALPSPSEPVVLVAFSVARSNALELFRIIKCL
jgi:hypothetical protein